MYDLKVNISNWNGIKGPCGYHQPHCRGKPRWLDEAQPPKLRELKNWSLLRKFWLCDQTQMGPTCVSGGACFWHWCRSASKQSGSEFCGYCLVTKFPSLLGEPSLPCLPDLTATASCQRSLQFRSTALVFASPWFTFQTSMKSYSIHRWNKSLGLDFKVKMTDRKYVVHTCRIARLCPPHSFLCCCKVPYCYAILSFPVSSCFSISASWSLSSVSNSSVFKDTTAWGPQTNSSSDLQRRRLHLNSL